MRISLTLRNLMSLRQTVCPDEADVLAFFESRLSVRNGARLERHFTGCDDCRELLVVLGRESAETREPLALEATREQTNRVLSLIHIDELNRSKPEYKRRTSRGFEVSYLRLAAAALIICTIAIVAVVLLSRGQKPADAAMQALVLAVKDGRNTEARVSGGLGYARYRETRGLESKDDDLQFSRAISKLRFAEQETAPVNDKLALARVYLTRGTREDARHALTLLDQLATRGVETAEAFNDIGVAQFELEKYDEAIASFSKALAKSPSYSEALFNRALAEERAHRNDARRDWQQFINQSQNDNWKSEALSHLKQLGAEKDN